MRNMSFSMTTEAVRDHSKTVTRRLGWWDLKPGTILQAVEKAQGLKKGEHVKPICLIRVVSVRTERLAEIGRYDRQETAREGFPDLTTEAFYLMFREANACNGRSLVNRIEFEYVETHACPPGGAALTPCCGRSPFGLPLTDRMTLDPALVTCGYLP